MTSTRGSSPDGAPGRPNPVLAALGYSPETRLLVTHLDDVGMNPGANTAWEAVREAGAVSSASVMMPCPAAAAALETAGRLAAGGEVPDLGVHLTLTCEWEALRWGPLDSSLDGLLTDSRGALPRNEKKHLEITASPAGAEAAEKELRAQVDRALESFPDISHMDTHMFVMLFPPRLDTYMRLALDYRLPCMLPGPASAWRPWTRTDAEAAALSAAVEPLRTVGMPLFDQVYGVPLANPPADRPAAVRQLVKDCVPGLNFLFLHANDDTPEIRKIACDWQARKGDMDVFTDPSLRDFMRDEGVITVGMRELRDLFRRLHPVGRRS